MLGWLRNFLAAEVEDPLDDPGLDALFERFDRLGAVDLLAIGAAVRRPPAALVAARKAALGLVTHHDSRQLMVLYVSHATGTITVRPLKPTPIDPDAWDDWIEYEGKQIRRFSYLGPSGDKTPEAPAAAQ